MSLNRKNRKILFCIVAVLLVALTGTVTVLAIQMNKQITTKSVSSLTDYDIGSLDVRKHLPERLHNHRRTESNHQGKVRHSVQIVLLHRGQDIRVFFVILA